MTLGLTLPILIILTQSSPILTIITWPNLDTEIRAVPHLARVAGDD